MGLKIGIVGLPNVGKSTLFNALTQSEKAEAANFPFCTIDPNVGIVEVPDKRLERLAEIVSPENIIPATVEFVDIAGLVEGASKGEGLGNKFLSHIRECDAIVHVVRVFEDDAVHHVKGRPDPKSDLETILTELMLADLESLERQEARYQKKAKSGDKEAKKKMEIISQCKEALSQNQLLFDALSAEARAEASSLHLLTLKPFLIVANIAESQIGREIDLSFLEGFSFTSPPPVLPVCVKMEAELSTLPPEEVKEYLEAFGLENRLMDNFIRESYRLLNLETFFTAGKKEVRAWTIKKGTKAPQAAGVIHTDFERGFIKAEVISYDDFIRYKGEAGARNAGALRLEGKDYVVQDGDVIHFRFNV